MIPRKFLAFSLNASKGLRLYVTQIKKISGLALPSSSILLSNVTQQHQISIRYNSSAQTEPNLLASIWQKYKQKTGQRYSKNVLRQSALRLYVCCVELIPHDTFIREFDLPDTFNSWFRITELHLWMVLCRLAAEGKEGKVMRNFLIENTWKDIDKKSRKLQSSGSASVRKEGIMVLSEQFKASLFAYDEGILGSDKVLTGALWRGLFERECSNPNYLETLVEYVHKQTQYLDQVSSEQLLGSGIVQFVPLIDTPDLRIRSNQILAQIRRRI